MAYNLLVVDDSAVMRSMIIKTLNLSGLEIGQIHQAANGADGLSLLGREWIDLALVDIHMPVMDGEEMIGKMRGNPDTKKVPVVVISSESDKDRIAQLQGLGAVFAHKPFTPESLGQIITKALEGAR